LTERTAAVRMQRTANVRGRQIVGFDARAAVLNGLIEAYRFAFFVAFFIAAPHAVLVHLCRKILTVKERQSVRNNSCCSS
jgi:hypothetical protein